MRTNRRNFLIGAAAAGINSGTTPTFAAALGKQGPAVKKLVPPANGEPVKVAIALSKDVTPIDWVETQAVFGAWLHDDLLNKDRPFFEVFTVGPDRKPVDEWLVPDHTYADAPQAQVVVVPAQSGIPEFYEWLKKASAQSDVTMSVCIGARHLAKLGLLDGQTATTHHDFIKPYTEEFPKVRWTTGVRFVEGPRVSTSAGVTAGLDLSLHVFERYFGRQKALAAARVIEYQGAGWMV